MGGLVGRRPPKTTNSADEETITATIVTSAGTGHQHRHAVPRDDAIIVVRSDPIRSECSFFDTLIIVLVKTLKWNPILLYCYTVSKLMNTTSRTMITVDVWQYEHSAIFSILYNNVLVCDIILVLKIYVVYVY